MIEDKNIPWIHNDSLQLEKVHVTDRSYEQVIGASNIHKDYFKRGKIILSIGEGLSNFVKVLQSQGVDAYALDPIYNGAGEIMNLSKLPQTFQKRYGARVKYDGSHRTQSHYSQLPSPDSMIGGSVYNLPFRNKSIDLITLNAVTPFLDLRKTLPELFRVLKDSGEIRFSGDPAFSINPATNKLLPVFWIETDDGMGAQSLPATKLDEIMEYVNKNNLSIYIQATERGPKKINVFGSRLVVIRKDNRLPKFSNIDNPRERPNILSVYKVSPKRVSDGYETSRIIHP